MMRIAGGFALPKTQPKFQGVYAMVGGDYGPPLEKFNDLTDEIRRKAAQQNLPLIVEEETRYEGMGNSSLIRYFLTGKDALGRQSEIDKFETAKKVYETALDAVTQAAQKALEGVMDKALAEKVREGKFSQAEADALKRRISLGLKIKGVPENPPALEKRVQARHYLIHQFVTRRVSNNVGEKTNLIKAVRSGHFNVETGKLAPDTPYEPEGPNPPYEWYKEKP